MSNFPNIQIHIIRYTILTVLVILPLGVLSDENEFDIDELSVESLMNTEISSVSKSQQKLSDAASAVFVITQNDIRRSGYTNLPDLLRMVPGLSVARISSNKWSVSARGFDGRLANKLLVLIDNRVVYTPTFSGVYWENLDLIFSDIDRIEVIRGPGASVWGANAVNGVINIITKHAEQTHGAHISAVAGDENRGIASFRYGDKLSQNIHYRVYGKYRNHDGAKRVNGDDAEDEWQMGRAGFRVDWDSRQGDSVMAQAEVYTGSLNINYADPDIDDQTNREQGETHGAHFLVNWEKNLSTASRLSGQFFYEHFSRKDPFQDEIRDTFDIELQHEIAWTDDNYFTWGVGYRRSSDFLQDSPLTSFSHASQDLDLYSLFLQDRIDLFNDALELSGGVKIQHYTYGGWQFQPSAKLLWRIDSKQRFWFSFTKASRLPSRGERSYRIKPFKIIPLSPVTVGLTPNPEFKPEKVTSYEVGYRTWPVESVSLDLTFFYNEYRDIFNLELVDPNQFPNFAVFPANNSAKNIWGGEVAADWRVIEALQLQFAYSLLASKYKKSQVELEFLDVAPKVENYFHQLSLRGNYAFSPEWSFDAWFRYIDDVLDLNTTLPGVYYNIPSYTTMDFRIAWMPDEKIELAFIGRNLFEPQHLEYLEEFGTVPIEIERHFYGQIKLNF